MRPHRWIIAPVDPAADALARSLALPAALAQTLVNRGLHDPASAREFLHPRLQRLGDPFALPAMTAAVARLQTALCQGEPIVLYGDYDVDGVTSCALLARVLTAAGAAVHTFLPQRLAEGYGLSAAGLTRCCREHAPRLLVAVDCGTTAVAEIADLQSRGVDVIVLDHHEPQAERPACVALVNPKCQAAAGRELASVGVAFKLAHALLKHDRTLAGKIDLRDHLDLVALGTVADLVPLVGDNRILVKTGLERLAQTDKIGLRALLAVAGITGAVNPGHVGFRLGPRLNAAGRLADARAALELLVTTDAARARELAALLHQHNAQRQQLEERIVAAALAQAQQFPADRVLVLADETWHAGVIGIVAQRVVQEFYRPTIVIGTAGKGSGRSVAGFSLIAALDHGRACLKAYGGHEMAAGLTVTTGQVAALRCALNAYAHQTLGDADLQPRVAVDAIVRLEDLDDEFFRWLAQFEPCGLGNPTPCFVAHRVRLAGSPRLLKEKHLKFHVTDGETTCPAIWWNAGAQTLPSGEFDLAFVPELNEYREAVTIQLRVRAVRCAAG